MQFLVTTSTHANHANTHCQHFQGWRWVKDVRSNLRSDRVWGEEWSAGLAWTVLADSWAPTLADGWPPLNQEVILVTHQAWATFVQVFYNHNAILWVSQDIGIRVQPTLLNKSCSNQKINATLLLPFWKFQNKISRIFFYLSNFMFGLY